MNSPQPAAVEVQVVPLAPYGGKKHSPAFTLPDHLPLLAALRARKFTRVIDRNWKSRLVFLK